MESLKTNLYQPLVWVDLEMSGLDAFHDHILEIAVILTDGSMDKIIEGPNIAIKTDREILEKMS